ncbi:unnamed protein product [Sphagnum jensenii]|uniref:Uncharacterized protein n=1 Tax=Sphagnum jensenii TaxID=128206 RepID=A0ABP1A217_9BRYO
MYPILRKGQRLVVKGLLGKCKCFMNLKKEDGKLDTLHNVQKVDIVPEMNAHTQDLFAMAPASTLHALSEVRGKSSNSKINHLDTMGVPEGTKTSCMDGLPTVPMNCKEVEVQAKEENITRFAGEKHGNVHQVKWKRDFVHEYYAIEDKEWNWSPAFLLLKDSPLQSAIGPGLKGQEQKLANEIASFKAPLESPVHQEVVKRLFDCFVASISKDCVMMLGNSVEMMKAKAELRSVMQRAIKEINSSMIKVSDRHQVLNGEVDSFGRGSLHCTVVAKNLEKLEHSHWGKGISQLDSLSHTQLDTGRKLEDINLGTVESTLLSKTRLLVGVGTEESDIQFEMQDSCVVGNHKPSLQDFSNTINGHKWVESAPTSQTYAGCEW